MSRLLSAALLVLLCLAVSSHAKLYNQRGLRQSSASISRATAGPGQNVVANCAAGPGEKCVNEQYGSTGSGRKLFQATAIATSTATATGGGQAVSNVRAGAVSTGQPTAAVAQGAATAGAEQNVRVNCEVFAKDSTEYKACINNNTAVNVVSNATAAATAAAAGLTWETAATCSPPLGNATVDSSGRLWGFENGTSCAFRFADGSPVYATNATAAAQAAAQAGAAATTTAVSFEDAPACQGEPGTSWSVQDSSGRYWGYQNGTSCAYKTANGTAIQPVTAQAQAQAEAQAKAETAARAAAEAAAAATGEPTTATATATAQANATGRRKRSM